MILNTSSSTFTISSSLEIKIVSSLLDMFKTSSRFSVNKALIFASINFLVLE